MARKDEKISREDAYNAVIGLIETCKKFQSHNGPFIEELVGKLKSYFFPPEHEYQDVAATFHHVDPLCNGESKVRMVDGVLPVYIGFGSNNRTFPNIDPMTGALLRNFCHDDYPIIFRLTNYRNPDVIWKTKEGSPQQGYVYVQVKR